jgi:hypothetical protein
MNDGDAIASLNTWQPSATLPSPTSRFTGANAGVSLSNGKTMGKNIALQPTQRTQRTPVSMNMTVTLQQSGGGAPNTNNTADISAFVNQSPTKVHPHSVHNKTGDRFAPIPRQKVVRSKNGGPVSAGSNRVNLNSDGTQPWYTAAMPGSGEYPDANETKRSPLENGKVPKDPISPAHTRIFNSTNSNSPQDLSKTRLYQPSPPRNMVKNDGEERERRKFNCCRQVMDILEKHDYKLKKTFNHTDQDTNSIKVRSNHTFSELTGVLREMGAKVDEGEVREAFKMKDNQEEVTFSPLAAISTDVVYPGSNNGHKDFFDVPKRDGKRVGGGPGARHNDFQSRFLEHNMKPAPRTELAYVERAEQEQRYRRAGSHVDTHSNIFPPQATGPVAPRDDFSNRSAQNTFAREDFESNRSNAHSDHNSYWTNKTVNHGPKLGLGGGKKASGEMSGKVSRDHMNDIVFHGRYDEMRPAPVSKVQYSPSFNAPFANFDNTPPDY